MGTRELRDDVTVQLICQKRERAVRGGSSLDSQFAL